MIRQRFQIAFLLSILSLHFVSAPVFAQGTPSLSAAIAGHGPQSGAYFVDLRLTNSGSGNAQNVRINAIALKTLAGTGAVTLHPTLSPALPITVGSLATGASTTVRFFITYPPTVSRFSATESGTIQNAAGATSNFSLGQSIFPVANRAPVVNAGADQTITLPAAATLNGTITDDGLPVGAAVTPAWTKVSGPGTVTFTPANTAATSATFSQAGPYVLRLSATDGSLAASDDIGVTVNSAAVPKLLSVNPSTGQQGQNRTIAVTAEFTNFVQGTTQPSLGAGITVVSVTVTSATSLTANISIAPNAAVGPRILTVTTGAEVVALNDAFNVTAAIPALTSVIPNSGRRGQTVDVTITGSFTNFVQGTTQASFGADISVGDAAAGSLGPVTVTNGTTATAQLRIGANATPGPRTVTVRTGTDQVTLAGGFAVSTNPPPAITDFNPKSGPVGTLVNVTGANFIPNAGMVPALTLNRQGGGTIAAPLSSFTGTTLAFVIPAGADTGLLNVSVGGQTGSSAVSLTITASSMFTLTAAPNAANLIQGQSTSYAITLSSSSGFSQLATLSLTGLPSGVTAAFKPAQITAGQTSVLSVSAPASQQAGSTPLSVSASATVDGIDVSQSAALTLNVNPATTSLLGRTVVDDTLETPLRGVTITMLGKNGNGGTTTCTGSTTSDDAGNFELSNLPPGCVGPQLVGYDGLTVTSPEGKYAGVNLIYTLQAGQVTVSPVLVHLPRIDTRETFYVQQNSATDQSYAWTSVPGLSVTVYRGTTFTLPNGTAPNPFPLVAVQVPVDRLPDAKPPVPTMLSAFIVAFQPANAVASKPAAVFYPNTLNTPPRSTMTMMTLDPTRGRMVPYGTATVSTDGKQIIPDLNPSLPGTRYGIVNFDWHGPMPAPPTSPADPPPEDGPEEGCPCDLTSGLETVTATDISIDGPRGLVAIVRNYRSLSTIAGPFGIGTNHNYGFTLDQGAPQTQLTVNLILPAGTRVAFSRETTTGPFVNTTVPALRGVAMNAFSTGHSEVRWKDGTVFRFTPGTFQGLPALESITDPNGNRTTFTRNPSAPAQMTQVTDAVGRSLNLTYDTANRITSVTDPIGRTVRYTYNSQGTLETVIDAEGGVTRYEYDSQNQLLRHRDARGVVIAQNVYGVNRRLTQQAQADGGVLKFNYTFLNPTTVATPILATEVVDARGYATLYRFDPAGLMSDVQDASGQVLSLIRSPEKANQVVEYRGGATCRSCGNTAVGGVTLEHDDQGNVLKEADALGNETTFVYDSTFSKLTSTTDPLGNRTSFTYDSRGNLLTQTDANGKTTSYTYNSFGQPTETTDPLGRKTRFEYDAFGNVINVTDPLNNVTQFRYDGISRLVEVMDSLGRKSTTEYDKLDRVVRQTDSKGQVSTFTYDAVGNLTSLRDGRGKTTSFTYDSMNRLKTRTDPLGKADTRNYDLNGNLTSFVDRRGQTSSFTYDELNRLKEERYADGTLVKRFYDARGRLVRVEDSAGGTFTFTYNLAGQLTASSGPAGAVDYDRDSLGRVSRRQVVGQPAVGYSYDPEGNLLGASMAQASVAFSYDARNLPATVTRPNGVNSTYAFDPAGRLQSILHARGATPLQSLLYSYDASGNRVSQQTSDAQPLVAQAAAGSYDDANRLLQRGSTTYRYDDSGNLISETSPTGTTTYVWDSRNRLASITSSTGGRTDFVYDFSGNLIRQTDSGAAGNVTRHFTLDELTNVVHQQSTDGDQLAILTGQGIDSHLAVVSSSGQTEYALQDAINSTVATVDQAGATTGQLRYDPFGDTSASGTNFPFQYTGRVPVNESLYYYRARFYDPKTGRFISPDPSGLRDTTSTYSYAENNPIALSDPTGRCPWCVAAVIGGLTDLTIQLAFNGFNLKCVNWKEVAVSAAAAGIGVGIAQKLGKVSTVFGGPNRPTYRFFKAKDVIRVESHPISSSSPNWYSYPHWHADFAGKPWSKMHLPLVEPIVGVPSAAYNAGKGGDCECK